MKIINTLLRTIKNYILEYGYSEVRIIYGNEENGMVPVKIHHSSGKVTEAKLGIIPKETAKYIESLHG